MNVVLLSLLLIFEFVQQAALVNFMLFLNILKISNLMLNIFKGKLKSLFPLGFLYTLQNGTGQTDLISKIIIKF